MIPEINIKVSWVHNLMFDKNRYLSKNNRAEEKYNPAKGKALLEKSGCFIKQFGDCREKVLTLIMEKTGFEWQEKKINAYISDTVPNSYEEPLTLKFRDNADEMILVFIHELVHRNIPADLQENATDFEREQWADAITKEVCEDIGLSCPDYPGFENLKEFKKDKNKTLREFLEDYIPKNLSSP